MAKRRRDIPDMEDDDLDIVDHRHCVVCEKPIPPDKVVCSPACQKVYDKKMKERKLYLILFYGAVFVFIITLLIGFL